jgi:Tfp pilus assembly protein PilF
MPRKYAEILYWDGLIDYQHSSYEEAIVNLSRSLKHDESNLDAKYHRAKAYEKSGQMKKALADLKDLKIAKYKDAQLLYTAIDKL